MSNTKSLTMEKLFKQLGYDYRLMPEESMIDIRERNIKIKSYDINKQVIVFKRINKIIRKKNCPLFMLMDNQGKVLLKATGDHMVYNPKINIYQKLKTCPEVICLTDEGEEIKYKIVRQKGSSPILDLEIDGSNCYFTNKILSHNSGGTALKFYTSQRLDIRRIATLEQGEDKIGIRTKIKAIKNKVASPFRTTEVNIKFGKGLDYANEVATMAVNKNLIEKGGTWFTLNGEKFQGQHNLDEHLRSNPDVLQDLVRQIKGG